MADFGWISDRQQPPSAWDLRLTGWTLCGEGCSKGDLDAPELLPLLGECRHVLIVDAGALTQPQRLRLVRAARPAWRLLLLGVDEGSARAELLGEGCGEALAGCATLGELDARARRVADLFQCLPRWRDAGPLRLDLFHRDGRIGRRWLGLHPREFSLLWRLAADPGARVTRRELLHDVWRLDHNPETNSLEVHVSRLRGKLARLGCVSLVETVTEGGYRLAAAPSRTVLPSACCAGPQACEPTPGDPHTVAAD